MKSIMLSLGIVLMLSSTPLAIANPEPNVELAKLWWPDQRNVWTPIGWKDHYFRFNVLYNGTLVFEPFSDLSARPQAKAWKGQDFQITFTPWPNTNTPALPTEQVPLWKLDGGHGVQGWRTNCETPVLWTDFPLQEGMVIRQEIFGHLQGGDDVTNGLDPLYAWVRLSVTHVDPLRAPKAFPMILQLSRNYHALVGRFAFENGVTVDVVPDRAPYQKELRAEEVASGQQRAVRILEPDGKVRLVILPTGNPVQFFERAKGIFGLKIDLEAKAGESADLLVPMFPLPPENIEKELRLGFDGALSESDRYWKRTPGIAGRFEVPEQFITEAIRQNVKFAPLITEKNFELGDYSFLSGSWGYDQLWPTPSSMNSHMFLSLLGYHELVEQYTELFRKHQGTIKPPGPAYAQHPGYFGAPRHLTSIDWLTDHGAVLLQASTHALLSGDQEFIDRWTDPIIKACEFIKEACTNTNHQGIVGLLPPAVATDEIVPMQAIWNMAWNYKGLTKAVQLLHKINHPRASEFEALAGSFKETFVRSFREASAKAPKWSDSKGIEHPMPPTAFSKQPIPHHPYSDAFYLDTGPMVLVWAGLMNADDPLMQASVKFFREGPNWKLKGPRFNAICRPVLEREMSTCEPCYSWNVVHSWQLGDREKYLEGMYSLFVGSLSQQTYIACEHRDGMQGNLFSTPLAFWMARQAVIDDEIKPGELHLLRMVPQAWLSADKPSRFEQLPTSFGDVSLVVRKSADGKELNVSFAGKWRDRPNKIVLHRPPLPGLERLVLNGKSMAFREDVVLQRY